MEKQRRVVVVAEDEWLIREVAREILSDAGFTVIEASDAASGLAAVQAHAAEVSALFTDVRMPGAFDGLELARRARDVVPHLAILVTSGHVWPKAEQMPPGCQFLQKPYSARELPVHMARLMEKQA